MHYTAAIVCSILPAVIKMNKAVGQALKKSQIPRSNVFLTTKAYIQEMGYQPILNAFDKFCRRLGTDYLDLYLIHMPLNDYFGSWRALEKTI